MLSKPQERKEMPANATARDACMNRPNAQGPMDGTCRATRIAHSCPLAPCTRKKKRLWQAHRKKNNVRGNKKTDTYVRPEGRTAKPRERGRLKGKGVSFKLTGTTLAWTARDRCDEKGA